MSKIIKEFHPKYNIISNRSYPRSGAFEIEINGKIVFSNQEEIEALFSCSVEKALINSSDKILISNPPR